MGGVSNRPPLIKSKKNDWNLVKRHVLAKIDYFCPLFMPLELNYYHFWPPKGPKNRCIFTHIEGSPHRIVCGKNCRCKIFWKFQKEIPTRTIWNPFHDRGVDFENQYGLECFIEIRIQWNIKNCLVLVGSSVCSFWWV